MKKTFTVNLNQIVFNLEEDAFETLKQYLDSIRRHFAKNPDRDEIVGDIEARAAEKFGELLSKKKSVIVLADVEKFIASMGTVKDIAGDDAEEPAATAEPEIRPMKRLYKNPDDVIIAGVASGIAAYLGVDPSLVRVIFVVLLFTGGVGFWLYPILWLVLPTARTSAEKMEMRGDPVTLSGIEATLKAKLPESNSGNETGLARLLLLPFRLIGETAPSLARAAVAVVPILSGFIGIVIIVAAALALSGLVTGTITLLANRTSSLIQPPVLSILPPAAYNIGAIALFFVAFVPVIVLLLIGASFVQRRSVFTLGGSLSLLVLWILAISTAGVVAVSLAPEYGEQIESAIEQYRDYAFQAPDMSNAQVYDLKDFTQIDASGWGNVFIEQGPEYSVKVVRNDRGYTQTELRLDGTTLHLESRRRTRLCIGICNSPSYTYITMPVLDGLNTSGVVRADIKGFDQEAMRLILSGASKTTAAGAVKTLKISVEGVSTLSAKELVAETAEVITEGTARATVNVTSRLNATAEGVSKISYYGNPRISQNASGVSRIVALEAGGDVDAATSSGEAEPGL